VGWGSDVGFGGSGAGSGVGSVDKIAWLQNLQGLQNSYSVLSCGTIASKEDKSGKMKVAFKSKSDTKHFFVIVVLP